MSVEEFNPRITNEEIPFFMVDRNVVQNISNIEAGFVWVYLRSMSSTWKVIKEHIQKHFKIGEKKCKSIFAWLNKHGLIEYVKERDSKGVWTTSEIRVLNGSMFKASTGAEIHPVDYPPGGESRTNINKQNNTDKKSNKSFCSSDDEREKNEQYLFDRFWEAYPKKVGKIAALKAWKKKSLHEKADLIISDIYNRLAQNWKGKDRQYIPDPATYLNGEKWNDELFVNGEKRNGRTESKCEENFGFIANIFQRGAVAASNPNCSGITADTDCNAVCQISGHLAEPVECGILHSTDL